VHPVPSETDSVVSQWQAPPITAELAVLEQEVHLYCLTQISQRASCKTQAIHNIQAQEIKNYQIHSQA